MRTPNTGREIIRKYVNSFFPMYMTKYYYKKILKRKLNLESPETFNEKINWLKFNYFPYNKLAIQCTDKFTVREYLKSKDMEKYLNDLLGVWNRASDINWDDLPNEFVLKCNHGCKMNIICKDKKKFDTQEAKKQLDKWMNEDFGRNSIQPHYSQIERKIICEKYIENLEDNNGLPSDYKIHCFNGVPRIIAYYSGRDKDLNATFYNIEWDLMDIAVDSGPTIEKPVCLKELVNASSILSKDFPYVRIDFYIQREKIIFGELTFTPANGMSAFMTYEGDALMGRWLDITSVNKFNE